MWRRRLQKIHSLSQRDDCANTAITRHASHAYTTVYHGYTHANTIEFCNLYLDLFSVHCSLEGHVFYALADRTDGGTHENIISQPKEVVCLPNARFPKQNDLVLGRVKRRHWHKCWAQHLPHAHLLSTAPTWSLCTISFIVSSPKYFHKLGVNKSVRLCIKTIW